MSNYPAGPYGFDQGQTFQNYSFMGFRNGADPFTELSLSDYYDPDLSNGIKALFITYGWNGCGACISESHNMNTWDGEYHSEGLRQLYALRADLQTPNGHGPATESTAQSWIRAYAPKYDVVIDPTMQLSNGATPPYDPHSWLVDPKTMKITYFFPGAPGSLLPGGLNTLLAR